MTTGPGVRVHQLAEVFGSTSREAIQRLAERGVTARSASAVLSWEEVAGALSDHEAPGDLTVARSLIIKAFEIARSSGKDDWESMPFAVLKNRLLDLTDRSFSEIDYGAPTFGYFVHLFPDVVTVKAEEGRQPRVFINEEAMPDLLAIPSFDIEPPEYVRLRQDIWKAFFDFKSGNVYVWDSVAQRAIVGQPTETRIILPTVTPAEEAEWRDHFVSNIVEKLSSEEEAAVERWRRERLGTVGLPVQLRGPWNGYLRENIDVRVRRFFDDHGLQPPTDLLVSADESRRPERKGVGSDLRALVLRCVREMTTEELGALPIPARVMLRVQEAWSKGSE